MGGFTLSVDRIRCDGSGLCAELLPEGITLDDWGYPIIASGAVPDHLVEHARRAVASCPLLALRLERAEARAAPRAPALAARTASGPGRRL
ncbi:MAG TPA: ferredoxin [Candidatus Dormibacteraeota bacterium]